MCANYLYFIEIFEKWLRLRKQMINIEKNYKCLIGMPESIYNV